MVNSRPQWMQTIFIAGWRGSLHYRRPGRWQRNGDEKGVGSLWRKSALLMVSPSPPKTPDPIRVVTGRFLEHYWASQQWLRRPYVSPISQRLRPVWNHWESR